LRAAVRCALLCEETRSAWRLCARVGSPSLFPSLAGWRVAEEPDVGVLLTSQQLLWEVVAA